MTLSLIAHHLTSATVVLTCWWLAHSENRLMPPGRLVAAGYSFVGFMVLLTAVGRHVDPYASSVLPWTMILSKAAMSVTFSMVIYRQWQVRKALMEKTPPAMPDMFKVCRRHHAEHD